MFKLTVGLLRGWMTTWGWGYFIINTPYVPSRVVLLPLSGCHFGLQPLCLPWQLSGLPGQENKDRRCITLLSRPGRRSESLPLPWKCSCCNPAREKCSFKFITFKFTDKNKVRLKSDTELQYIMISDNTVIDQHQNISVFITLRSLVQSDIKI